MSRRFTIGFVIAFSAAASTPLLGQLSKAGDLDPQGRILTKISVRAGVNSPSPIQVPNVSLFVVSEKGAPQPLLTNQAGNATVWLYPGQYRIVSRNPVSLGDRAYSWDFVVQVRAGSAQVTLTEENASHVAIADQSKPKPPSQTHDVFEGDAIPSTWFSGTLAYGAMSCSGCNSFVGGPSASVGFGKIINPALLLGIGGTGWTRSQSGVTVTVASVDARVRFYPASNRVFFITAGVGAARLTGKAAVDSQRSEMGPSGLVGGGLDFPVSANLSVTPSWTAFYGKTSNADARISQLGLGVTFR